MNDFDQLQVQHESLLRRQLAGEDITQEVQVYIKLVQEKSSSINVTGERDQLRANLRYWANYIYEKNNSYPNIDLAPASVVSLRKSNYLRYKIFLLLLLGLILIGLFITLGFPQKMYFLAFSIQTPTNTVRIVSPTWTSSLTPPANSTPTASLTATPNRTPTMTTIPITSRETATLTPLSADISVEISTPANGDWVQPETIFRGQYRNLLPGWSIHLLTQPLSKGGLIYTLPNFFIVPEGIQSGEWVIETILGQNQDLETQETYIIQVVVALDESGRNALIESESTGVIKIPDGIIPFQALITVRRQAFKNISGVRMIFSQWFADNLELVASLPDGSDPVQITHSPSISELEPSISSDGTRIAYIGRRRDINRNPIYTVEIIESNGRNPVIIAPNQDGVIYETPLWSSDDRYLVYSIGKTDPSSGQTKWSVQVYDLENQQAVITYEDKYSYRYPFWIPGSHKLVFNGRIITSGTGGFLIANLDGADPKSVEVFHDSPYYEEVQPAISPNQKFLSFMGWHKNEKRDIFLVDLQTNKVSQLTDNNIAEFLPRWNLDGTAIFFWRLNMVTGNYEICSYELAAQKLSVLLESQEALIDPYVGQIKAYLPIVP